MNGLQRFFIDGKLIHTYIQTYFKRVKDLVLSSRYIKSLQIFESFLHLHHLTFYSFRSDKYQ